MFILCQAIHILDLPTKAFGIDSWIGDEQAGYYGSEVYSNLKAYHDPLYANFSSLVKNTFHDALYNFEEKSIDLLHIDGFHTYQVVSHDFHTWLPKMSGDGIILFHDICVKEESYGVWKLWDEIKPNYPSFEFEHGNGLGILAVGPNAAEKLSLLLDNPDQAGEIREFFSSLGKNIEQKSGSG